MGTSNKNMNRDVGGQRRKEISKSKSKNEEADNMFDLKRSEETKAKFKQSRREKDETKKVDNKLGFKRNTMCDTLASKFLLICHKMIKKNTDKCSYSLSSYVGGPLANFICGKITGHVDCNLLKYKVVKKLNCKKKEVPRGVAVATVILTKVPQAVFGSSRAAPGDTTLLDKVNDLRKQMGQESLMKKKREFLESVREYTATLIFHFHIIITFLMVMFIADAVKYHSDYHRSLYYENRYIGQEFSRIDENRRVLSKATLLPLKSIEKSDYMQSLGQSKYTEVEKDMTFNHAQTAVIMIASIAVLYIVDLFSFELAHSQVLSSEVTYEQIMKDRFYVRVKGHSGVAHLINSMVRHLDVEKDIHRFIHTDKCRP